MTTGNYFLRSVFRASLGTSGNWTDYEQPSIVILLDIYAKVLINWILKNGSLKSLETSSWSNLSAVLEYKSAKAPGKHSYYPYCIKYNLNSKLLSLKLNFNSIPSTNISIALNPPKKKNNFIFKTLSTNLNWNRKT